MNERDNPLLTAELTEEQNGNMLDGILNNLPPSPHVTGKQKPRPSAAGSWPGLCHLTDMPEERREEYCSG